jgi:hypothetical protein
MYIDDLLKCACFEMLMRDYYYANLGVVVGEEKGMLKEI